MTSAPKECLVMVAPQEQELLTQGAAPEALTTILIVAGTDGGGGGGGEEVGDETEVLSTERALRVAPKGVEDGEEVVLLPEETGDGVSLLTEESPGKTTTTTTVAVPRYTKQPAQVSLPPEMASKLGRQDSSDSVGSMEEEGIQADAAPPEGQDAPLERAEEEGEEGGGPESLEPRSERSSSVVSDASEEGGRDSGIEAEREPDMVLPDGDLMARIVAQVEYYFSDSNVAKDKFLLKHIRRNKEGYVSLKLVSSFKKVKQLTKDWRVVAHSLSKCSHGIQINDAGTKIRRVAPLPDLEEAPVTCAVLVTGMPLEKPSVQSVSELFSSCGDIAFIRVLRAGGALPQDLKALAAKHPALGDSNCAWVEFEAPEGAKAAAEMSNEEGMKVLPILPDADKKQKQQEKAQQKGSQPNSRKNSVAGCGGGCGHQPQQQKGPASRKNSFAKVRKDSTAGGSATGSEGEAPQYQRFPRRKCLSLPQTQSPNLKELSAVVEARRNRPKSKSCTEFQLGGVGSPSAPPSSSSSWVQRHLLAAAAASAASAASPVVGSRPPVLCRPARISQGSLPLPDGVVRFPKGPDGSKGFNAEARRRTTSSPAETTGTGAATTTTTNTTTSSPSSPSASPAGDGTPSSS